MDANKMFSIVKSAIEKRITTLNMRNVGFMEGDKLAQIVIGRNKEEIALS